MATVTQLPVIPEQDTPQPSPLDSTLAYFDAGFELGLVVGAERLRKELGIPGLLASHTEASCKILSLVP